MRPLPAPPASDAGVRSRMQQQRTSGTAPEMALRRVLHSRGMRYRVGVPLGFAGMARRSADVVFAPSRTAVFVDGCAWHGCPAHWRAPKRNAGWWTEKIGGNRARDVDTTARLVAAGWAVVRVWEHTDPAAAADAVEQVVRRRRGDPQAGGEAWLAAGDRTAGPPSGGFPGAR